eukprot:388384-Amorphochlora_amoeboformis.AAC.1
MHWSRHLVRALRAVRLSDKFKSGETWGVRASVQANRESRVGTCGVRARVRAWASDECKSWK